MTPHCRGCAHHHNAGHPKGSPLARKCNDWCAAYSRPAAKAVGACKLNGTKLENQK